MDDANVKRSDHTDLAAAGLHFVFKSTRNTAKEEHAQDSGSYFTDRCDSLGCGLLMGLGATGADGTLMATGPKLVNHQGEGAMCALLIMLCHQTWYPHGHPSHRDGRKVMESSFMECDGNVDL